MVNEKNEICKEFDFEMWLFAAAELPAERMEFWNNHLADCNNCLTELEEELKAVAIIKETTMIELDNATFNCMINKAVSRKSNWAVRILSAIHKYFADKSFYTKVTLAGGFATVTILFVILTHQSPSVESVPEELLDWEGAKITTQIKEINNRFDRLQQDSWGNRVKEIDKKIEQLKKASYEF